MQDHLTYSGANALAARIRDYWAKQGLKVRTFVEPVLIKDGGEMYSIRSDMVGGQPVR